MLPNSRVLILTGPRIQLSQDLIARFKALFPLPSQLPETEKAIAIINNVRVGAFPSFHCSAARGYTDVPLFILVDEASFWPPHQIQEVMGVVSGYITKPNSQSQIVFCRYSKQARGHDASVNGHHSRRKGTRFTLLSVEIRLQVWTGRPISHLFTTADR